MKLYAIYISGVKVSYCEESELVDRLSELKQSGETDITSKRIS